MKSEKEIIEYLFERIEDLHAQVEYSADDVTTDVTTYNQFREAVNTIKWFLSDTEELTEVEKEEARLFARGIEINEDERI